MLKCVTLSFWIALFSFLIPSLALAGQGCKNSDLTVGYMQDAIKMSIKLEKYLDKNSQNAAIIGRVGSDISDQGLKFTHAAFVRKDVDQGKWIVTHLLNVCGTGKSYLTNHGLLNFMMDDLLSMEVKVIIPDPALQKALSEVLISEDAAVLYEPSYSIISNPMGPLLHQNSNHWVLDVVAQAQALTEGRRVFRRADTQQIFLNNGFRGSDIRISTLKRLGARVGRLNVHFDDHPSSALSTGHYKAVSVNSIDQYFRRGKNHSKSVVLQNF
jgi:hypothetical protein